MKYFPILVTSNKVRKRSSQPEKWKRNLTKTMSFGNCSCRPALTYIIKEVITSTADFNGAGIAVRRYIITTAPSSPNAKRDFDYFR
ncbi:hypothetical protein EVAR_64602_1 [Eumeta japonica]|uniref:Uncharacterized protein n=1 Tax=Eumeta variegata TaxID=151549 RepID=A0A4C1ZB47_EUMVA|nr:hypothetical protein EVAR_64602_1 [Eumeta japonica]